jgi:hypothetical protein
MEKRVMTIQEQEKEFKVYKIYDRLKRVYLKREYKTLRTARLAADKMDMVYGAYRYGVAFLTSGEGKKL